MSIMSGSEGFVTESIMNYLHNWSRACKLPKEIYVGKSTLFNEGFRYYCAIRNIKVKNSWKNHEVDKVFYMSTERLQEVFNECETARKRIRDTFEESQLRPIPPSIIPHTTYLRHSSN